MRVLLQRVERASVSVNGEEIASIKRGLLAFLGIHKQDTENSIQPLVEKMLNLRCFADDNGKSNRSLLDTEGAILLVSQFTLYGDCSRGRRPDYFSAAGGEKALELYEKFQKALCKHPIEAAFGEFGADMKVSLINDGPMTLFLEKGP